MEADIEFVNIINYLQSVKQDLHKRYCPEIIDISKTHEQTSSEPQCVPGEQEHSEPAIPKAYVSLIKNQRKMIYRNDYGAQLEADKREQRQETFTGEAPTTTTTGDPHKPWNKLPNNMKIQAMLGFIDHLIPKLSDEQKNQLRFLLISSVSQKKLSKQTDVEYDSTSGQVLKIHHLTHTPEGFVILDENSQETPVNFPFTTGTAPAPAPTCPAPAPAPIIKKKLILLKK